MRRLEVLRAHLTPCGPLPIPRKPQAHQTSGAEDPSVLDVGERASQLLPGPIPTKGWRRAFAEYLAATDMGESHIKEAEWCREYGGSMTCNIVVPSRFFWREGDEGKVRVALAV